jgi:squalene synthase HpnC
METTREDTELQNGHPLGIATVPPTPKDAAGAARSGVGRVRQDLELFGPNSEIPVCGLDEAMAYCQRLATEHYENFSVVTRLAPREIRPHLSTVYAYCRWSDDLADEMGSPDKALPLLDWWRGELEECFAGRVRHPVFRALRQTITQFSLSKRPFEDLLTAFVQDQQVTRYASDAELLDYCARSANPVGRIVLQLAGCENPETTPLSDFVCTGLQLVNFCQDIPVDARRGRIYLPRARWQGIPNEEAFLLGGDGHAGGVVDSEMREAVASWTEQARSFLIRGLPLVKHGPRWLARSVQLFIRGGLSLVDNIAAQRHDVWTRPITVSRSQKLRWIAHSMLSPRSLALSHRSEPTRPHP